MANKITEKEKAAFAAFKREYALQANPNNDPEADVTVDNSELTLLYENDVAWIILNADEWVNVVWKDEERRMETIEL